MGGIPCTTCVKKNLECKTSIEQVGDEHPLPSNVPMDTVAEFIQDPAGDIRQPTVIPTGGLASLAVEEDEVNQINLELSSLMTTKMGTTRLGTAYFTHFHHRWPILHSRTYDEKLFPRLAICVNLMDFWLEGVVTGERAEIALSIHSRMMKWLVCELVIFS